MGSSLRSDASRARPDTDGRGLGRRGRADGCATHTSQALTGGACALWLASLLGCNPPFIDPTSPTDVVVSQVDAPGVDGAAGSGVSPDASSCPVEVLFKVPLRTRAVAVAGPWNGFSATATPLEDRGDGVFGATLALPPGHHPVRLVVDGRVETAPPLREAPPGSEVAVAVLTRWYEGDEYRSLRVPDCAAPALTLASIVAEPPSGDPPRGAISGTLCVREGASPLVDGALRLTVGDVAAELAEAPDPAPEAGVTRRCASFQVAGAPGKHSLRAEVRDAAGREARLLVPAWIEATPFRWDAGLLYMAMVDRFADSDGQAASVDGVTPIANHLGGDFAGLRAYLEDGSLTRLGVGALWLAPVLKNAPGAWPSREGHRLTSYHGYWPIDGRAVEPRLAETSAASPEAAFDALVAAAHARGVRVMLDVVLNHVHEDHVYCNARPGLCRKTCVCGDGGCGWEERPRECQFSAWLPDLDHRDHDGLVAVLDDAIAFVIDHDLDGLRVDAVKHLERAAITNLRAHLADRARLDDRLAPMLVLGETFTGAEGRSEIADTTGPGALDGQFDFPLYWTIRDVFARGASFRGLEAALVASEAAYGASLGAMSPFAGNHDVSRLATEVAGLDRGPFGATPDPLAAGLSDVSSDQRALVDRLTMAFAFTLTLRGVPLLYAGDEVGLAGSGDPDNRRLMPTAPSAAQLLLRGRVEALGQLRQASRVLSQGARRELWLDDDLLVQVRWLEAPMATDGARAVLVALNRGGARTVTLTFPPEMGLEGASFNGLGRDGRPASDQRAPFQGAGGRLEVRGGRAELALGAGEVRVLGAR
jgi:glycosidase